MKLLITLLATTMLSVAAQAASFTVKVQPAVAGKGIVLQFATVQTFNSMKVLHSKIISIKKTAGKKTGVIKIETRSNPKGIRLPAFGPHRGQVTLPDGLPAGNYVIVINDEDVGILSF